MKYKSKIDWWYYIIVLLFSYCTFVVCHKYATTQSHSVHPLLLILFLMCEFLFLLPNLLFTYYILEEECMFIRSGYISCRCIYYKDIVKIKDAKSMFSPGGLARERIEIVYKYKDSINTALISPKEKEKVRQELEAKVTLQNANDLSCFVKQENENNDQPMNGIIR